MIPVVNNNNYVNNPWFIMFPKFHHSAALVPMIFRWTHGSQNWRVLNKNSPLDSDSPHMKESILTWLVVSTYPSEKYARQLGWWRSQYMEKKMFQTTNQIINHQFSMIFPYVWCLSLIFLAQNPSFFSNNRAPTPPNWSSLRTPVVQKFAEFCSGSWEKLDI